MNKMFALTVVSLSLCIESVALAAMPETDKSKTESLQSRSSREAANLSAERAAPSDAWRFKLYEGDWWYWLPSNHWAVYQNHRWLMPPKENLVPGAESASPAASTAGTAAADAGKESGSFAEDYPAVPEGPESAQQSAEYHLAVGSTYNKHAAEHARILEKYSGLGETVPAGVVKDHAGAIRHDVEQAQQSFSRLAKADKDNPAVAEAVEKIQRGLRKVTESVQKLESHAQRQDAVQAQLIKDQTAEISALLNNSYTAAKEADREFYDLRSENYYTSGEGHFVD